MTPDLIEADLAILIELLPRDDRRRSLPVLTPHQAPQGDPGEARSAGATIRAVAGAEAAGRAERGAGEEAATVEGYFSTLKSK